MNDNYGISISISDESDELLDTGGGLKKAAGFFDTDDPFLVRNVDVLSDMDLGRLIEYHIGKTGLATLVVRERETYRYFLFDEEMKLSGWKNKKTNEEKITRQKATGIRHLAFSGIQVIDPGIFDLITETGKFSLTDMYLRLSKDHNIYGYPDKDSYWKDAGKTNE
jgi:NDP-sugar pyrophosphorylase family protein